MAHAFLLDFSMEIQHNIITYNMNGVAIGRYIIFKLIHDNIIVAIHIHHMYTV